MAEIGSTSAVPAVSAGPEPTPQRPRNDVRRLAGLLILLTAAAVALWIPEFGREHRIAMSIVAGALLTLGFVVFEGTQAHVEVRRQTFSLSLSEAPLVIGLALVAPPVLLVSRLVASVLISGFRRTAFVKAAFNLALVAAETGIAVRVSQALSRAPADRPNGWLATYAAVLLADLSSALWVTVAVTATQGRPTRRDLASFVPRLLFGGLLTTSLGLVAALAIEAERLAGIVIAVVGVLVLLTYRSYAALSQRHATLGEVHGFAQQVVAATGGAELIGLLLRDSARLLAADTATVWLSDPPPGMPVGLRLHHDHGIEELSSLPSDATRTDVLRTGRSLVLPRTPKSVWLTSQNLRDSVLVAIPGGSGAPLGLLELNDRLGEMSTFSAEDARTAEALAAHVAVALANDQLRARSIYDATHDALTSLPNRVLLANQLAEKLECGPAAVLVVDLDQFQEVNDSLGHGAGDEVLRQIAHRLSSVVRPDDTVARLGNDEFAILLPGQGLAEATETALGVRAALLEPVVLDGLAIDATGAVGLAVAPEHGSEVELLLRRAEAALRLAKSTDPPVQAWRTSMEPSDPRRLARVGEFRKALDAGELEVHYQPKVALPSGDLVGVESLVRWRHPTEGLLGADEFLPMAERTGLVIQLTTVVLRTALAQCRQWLDAGRRIPVAVNLSVRGLLDPDLTSTVAGLLTAYSLPPDLLSLEITESSVMADVPRAMPVLERLAGSGIKLSVDDFGTGYSSLAYLRRLPVAEVKIDKSFVQDMGTDESDAAIVATIIGLARHLGLTVVAEGVEDEGSRDRLVELGCDVAQGYLFSRPLTAQRLAGWLAARDTSARSHVRPLHASR